MSTLYELTNDLKDIEKALEVEVLEQSQECIKGLIDILEKQIQNKGENIIKLVKNKEAIVSSRKEEIKRLQELNKKDEKEIADLKRYTKECIERAGKKRVETVLGNLTVRKAQPVVKVLDATKLPADYLIQKTTINADKVKIKEHFKETGEILDGVEITLETSLTIPKAKKEKEEGEE
jgi:hypothetical protein